jgi:DNA-binding GntR family transcriptional regulator
VASITPNRASGDPITQAQRAYDELEDQIMHRVLPPGARLIEGTLATQLGLSRTPVREAIRQLQRDGWVTIQPHAGATVRSPSLEDVMDTMRLREVLETEGLRMAARRATKDDIKDLQTIVARGTRASARGDRAGMTLLGDLFHTRIAEATHDALLNKFLIQLYKEVRWHSIGIPKLNQDEAWVQHDAIVKAIASGDSDRAAAALKPHTERTRRIFIDAVLKEYQ